MRIADGAGRVEDYLDSPTPFGAGLLHPRYWLTWCALWLAAACAFLPRAVRDWLGSRLGDLLLRSGHRHFRVARRNLRLCLPGEDTEALLRGHARLTGQGLLQVFVFSFRSRRYQRSLIAKVEGAEHVRRNAEAGRGTLLLCPHHAHAPTVTAVYSYVGGQKTVILPRLPSNPALRWFEHRFLIGNTGVAVLPPRDTAALVRALREGWLVPFYCDQDYGANSSEMSEWFGIPASTLVNAPVIAARAKAGVVVASAAWGGDGYEILIEPWDEYAKLRGQEAADALNRALERHVRRQLPGWLWSHRRFKTRPEGAPSLYGDI